MTGGVRSNDPLHRENILNDRPYIVPARLASNLFANDLFYTHRLVRREPQTTTISRYDPLPWFALERQVHTRRGARCESARIERCPQKSVHSESVAQDQSLRFELRPVSYFRGNPLCVVFLAGSRIAYRCKHRYTLLRSDCPFCAVGVQLNHPAE